VPERYSVSVPPVTNNIYRSAAPAQNYLLEQRSAAFRHHYSPGYIRWDQVIWKWRKGILPIKNPHLATQLDWCRTGNSGQNVYIMLPMLKGQGHLCDLTWVAFWTTSKCCTAATGTLSVYQFSISTTHNHSNLNF